MSKKWRNLILALTATISVLWLGIKVVSRISFYREQRELAQRLEVNIHDYSPISRFPESYFLLVLRPGMAISDVHKLITEYKQVFRCGTRGEIYYYYSKDDDKAIRFKIIYDEVGQFRKLMGEDDSTRFGDDGCVIGLLDE